MPGYNYAEEMRPWTAAAGDVAKALTHLPVLRAQLARQRAADADAAAVHQAQIANYAAETGLRKEQTGKVNEETKRLATIGAATERLGKNFPVLVQALQSGDFSNPAATSVMGDMAMITGENKDDLAALVRNLASAQTVGRAGVGITPEQLRFAGALQNPVSVGNNEADNVALLQRGAAANASREKIAAMRPKPDEYETETKIYPGTKAREESTLIPGEKRSFLGLDFLARDGKARYETKEIPGTPSRRVTVRRRIGAGEVPFAPQSQDPDDSETGQDLQDSQEGGGTMPEPITQTATNAPAVKTVAGTRPKARTQADVDYAIKQANDAINGVGDYAGKPRDPETVKRMLQEMGIVLK